MSENDSLLREGAAQLGYALSSAQIQAFSRFLAELKKWNRVHNLTSLRTDREIIIKHFLDSLLFAKVLPAEVHSVADVGSGAGFPGVPLKILRPELQVILIEPARKKAEFLRHLCRTLPLTGAEVIERKIEDVSGISVDAVFTRALFTVGDLVEKTRGILSSQGVCILSKGPKLAEELQELKGVNYSVTDLVLPFAGTVRHIVRVAPEGHKT